MLILTMYLAPQHGTKLARIPLNKVSEIVQSANIMMSAMQARERTN